MPLGEAEFELNLDSARVHDAEKAAQHPNAPRGQVEAALTGTLKKNGIELTPDFYKGFVQLASTFQAEITAATKEEITVSQPNPGTASRARRMMKISITKSGFRAERRDMDTGEDKSVEVGTHVSQLRSVCSIVPA